MSGLPEPYSETWLYYAGKDLTSFKGILYILIVFFGMAALTAFVILCKPLYLYAKKKIAGKFSCSGVDREREAPHDQKQNESKNGK